MVCICLQVTTGPIFCLRVLTRKIIVLNSHAAVMDLLEFKSVIYLDRPKLWMYKVLAGRENSMIMMSSANPRFKIYRKLLHTAINPKTIQTEYHFLMERESEKFMNALYRRPDEYVSHLRHITAAVMLNIAYGWGVAGKDDVLVNALEHGFKVVAAATRPGWLVDVFPIRELILHSC